MNDYDLSPYEKSKTEARMLRLAILSHSTKIASEISNLVYAVNIVGLIIGMIGLGIILATLSR